MKIYLIRHGETDANRQRRLQGRLDIPLNESGRAQALEASKELSKISFDRIYSSPLARAVETGEIVSGVSREHFILDDRIQEISFGEAEGRPMDELGDEFARFFDAPGRYVPWPGAESLSELAERVGQFLSDIRSEKDEKVLVVSHGAAIHAMLWKISGCSLDQFWSVNVGNCGVTEIETTDEGYCITKECTVEDRYYGQAAAAQPSH